MNEPNSIYLEHVYTQAPATVWRALTTPELHAKWWGPGDVRPIVGHLFELDMGPWGKQKCEVLAVEPERLLQYRFAIGTLDTVMTWRLSPEGSGTRLSLEQAGFNLDSPMGRRALEGMKPGWPGILARMGQLMTTIHEIEQMEARLLQAELGPDPSFFEEALADDALLDGQFAKTKVVDAHRPGQGPKFTRVEMSDMRILDHGLAAVVTCTGTYEGPKGVATLRFMRVWVKKAKGWQIVAGTVSSA